MRAASGPAAVTTTAVTTTKTTVTVATMTVVTMTVAAMALATMTVFGLGSSPAMAHAQPAGSDLQLVNRMDGSRLATLHDSTAEGAQVIAVRSPALPDTTSRWTYAETGGGYVIRNEPAGKCLQPAAAVPKAGDGLVLKACDGSAAQDWLPRGEETASGIITGWYAIRPRSASGLALTLRDYQDSGGWDTVHLGRDQNSSDRLWRFVPSGATW